MAKVGICTSSCKLLPVFYILLLLVMLFTFMNNVPAIEVLLQWVYLSFLQGRGGGGLQERVCRTLGQTKGSEKNFEVVCDGLLNPANNSNEERLFFSTQIVKIEFETTMVANKNCRRPLSFHGYLHEYPSKPKLAFLSLNIGIISRNRKGLRAPCRKRVILTGWHQELWEIKQARTPRLPRNCCAMKTLSCLGRVANTSTVGKIITRLRAQWLISLFLVFRAHWFSGPDEKKKNEQFYPFCFCQILSPSGGRFPEFSPFVQILNSMWGGCGQKWSLPLFLFFSLQAYPQNGQCR